jgi:hypothetical protein
LCRVYASLCHTRLGGRCIESLTGGCAWVKLLLTRALGLCVLGLSLSRKEICFGLSHCVLRVLGIKAGENSVHFHEVANLDVALANLATLPEAEAGFCARPDLADERPVSILGVE